MNNEFERQGEATSSCDQSSTFVYLLAGLGIGAALSIFLAPRSGVDTRQWIANKILDGVETANEKVRQTRRHVKDVVDQGQQTVSELVDAGREAVDKSKAAAS